MGVLVLAINHLKGGGRREVENKPRGWWRSIVSGERGAVDFNIPCHNCNIRYELEGSQAARVLTSLVSPVAVARVGFPASRSQPYPVVEGSTLTASDCCGFLDVAYSG
jgi:hypothetical protein